MLMHGELLERVGDIMDLADRFDISNNSFYAFYRSILSGIYWGFGEKEIFRLFSIHTLLQIYLNSLVSVSLGRIGDPIAMCLGDLISDYGVSQHHLLWWRDLARRRKGGKILRICLDAISYAGSLDRGELLIKDPVSRLYESLVGRALRYGSGEYYTPRWIVDLILDRLEGMGADLDSELILDPSSGSGRFLAPILHRKISRGVDATSAYYGIMGFDVNPLAIAMARARLVIAYKLLTGKDPPGTPAVLLGDFVSLGLSISNAVVYGDRHVVFKYIAKNISRNIDFGENRADMLRIVTDMHGAVIDALESLWESRAGSGPGSPCRSRVRDADICYMIHRSVFSRPYDDLIALIDEYGGGLGAVIIASAILGSILRAIDLPRPGIVTTNPPWLEINELPKNRWGEMVRRYVRIEYARSGWPPRLAIQKGDLSVVFLDLALRLIKSGGYAGIVLPAEQSYSGYASSHGAGKLLTYSVLERRGCSGEILYLGDVFGHGVPASVAIVRKGDNA